MLIRVANVLSHKMGCNAIMLRLKLMNPQILYSSSILIILFNFFYEEVFKLLSKKVISVNFFSMPFHENFYLQKEAPTDSLNLLRFHKNDQEV